MDNIRIKSMHNDHILVEPVCQLECGDLIVSRVVISTYASKGAGTTPNEMVLHRKNSLQINRDSTVMVLHINDILATVDPSKSGRMGEPFISDKALREKARKDREFYDSLVHV